MTTLDTDQSKISSLPAEKWQATGHEFANHCEEALWSDVGIKALNYLRSSGMNDETLRKYHVGYNHKEESQSLEYWGLPNSYNSKGNLSKVRLPQGIVIPCFLENALQSIRVYRYLTQEQKSKGEQSYNSIKGSKSWLFGAGNLRDAQLVVFTNDELDVMLLDQEAGDIVGVASTGKAVIELDVKDLVMWSRFLLHIPRILIPYDQEHTIYWSMSTETDRAHRVCLSEMPEVKTFVDLWKSGTDLDEWVGQKIYELDARANENLGKSGLSRAIDIDGTDPANGVVSSKTPCRESKENLVGDVISQHMLVTHRFDQVWIIDPRIMPATPCHCCQNDEYWQRPDGGWICTTCHPNPVSVS